jgi:hypothetical protein
MFRQNCRFGLAHGDDGYDDDYYARAGPLGLWGSKRGSMKRFHRFLEPQYQCSDLPCTFSSTTRTWQVRVPASSVLEYCSSTRVSFPTSQIWFRGRTGPHAFEHSNFCTSTSRCALSFTSLSRNQEPIIFCPEILAELANAVQLGDPCSQIALLILLRPQSCKGKKWVKEVAQALVGSLNPWIETADNVGPKVGPFNYT